MGTGHQVYAETQLVVFLLSLKIGEEGNSEEVLPGDDPIIWCVDV